MTRHPRPRGPTPPLDRALHRLGERLRRVPVDPGFARGVEARIREAPVLGLPDRRRGIPGWAAVAAGVLLTLGAGLSTRSAPAPAEHGTQLPLAPPPQVVEEPESREEDTPTAEVPR